MTEQERNETLITIRAHREIMAVLLELLKGAKHPNLALTAEAYHVTGLLIQELEKPACDEDALVVLLDELNRLDVKIKEKL